MSTMQRLGAGLGVAVTAAVFAAHGSLGSAAGYAAGFRPALAVAAGLSFAGAVTALAVGPRRRQAADTAWGAFAGGRHKVAAINTGSSTL